jgi:hypothetical protein
VKRTIQDCQRAIALHNKAADKRERLMTELWKVSERQSELFGRAFDSLPDGMTIRISDHLELNLNSEGN